MRKSWLFLLAIAGILCISVPLMANEGAGGSGKPPEAHSYFYGKVSAVDAAASTISFTNKEGETKAFTIPAGTLVWVNDKAGALADITTEMYGGVKLNEAGTPIKVKANSPKPNPKPS